LRIRNIKNNSGKKHSIETRRLQSEKKKQYIMEHPEYLDYLKSICNNTKGTKKPNFSGIKHPFFGKKRPELSRRMMGKGNPNYGKIRKFKKYFSEALGFSLRSKWEIEIGNLLLENNIPFEYEETAFCLSTSTYIPDFVLQYDSTVIEVKGYLTDISRNKMIEFKKIYPFITLIGIGTGDGELYDIHLKWDERFELIEFIKLMGGNIYEIREDVQLGNQ
jgi:hypothetical protein